MHRHARRDPFRRDAEHFEKAVVDHHHLEIPVQHAQALRHVVQGGGELIAFFAHALVDEQPDGADRQHQCRRGGDEERKHARIDGGRRHHDPRIGLDADRSHRGEVETKDGGAQGQRRGERHRHIGRLLGEVYSGDGEPDTERK